VDGYPSTFLDIIDWFQARDGQAQYSTHLANGQSECLPWLWHFREVLSLLHFCKLPSTRQTSRELPLKYSKSCIWLCLHHKFCLFCSTTFFIACFLIKFVITIGLVIGLYYHFGNHDRLRIRTKLAPSVTKVVTGLEKSGLPLPEW